MPGKQPLASQGSVQGYHSAGSVNDGASQQYVAAEGYAAASAPAYNPYHTEVVTTRRPHVQKALRIAKNHGIQNILAPVLMLSVAVLYDFYLNPENPHYPDKVYDVAGIIGVASAFLYFLSKVADHGSAVRASKYNLRSALIAKGLLVEGDTNLEKSRAARLDQGLDIFTTGALIASATGALNHNPNMALGLMCGAAALKGMQFGLRGMLGEARYTQITGRNYTAQFTRQQKYIQYLVYTFIIGSFACGVETIRRAATASANGAPGNAFHSAWGISTVALASTSLYLYFMPNMMRGTDAYEKAIYRRCNEAAEANKPKINTLPNSWISRRDVKQELTFLAIQLFLAGGIALATKAATFTVVPAVGAALFVATILSQLATTTAEDDQRLANDLHASAFMTPAEYKGTALQSGEQAESEAEPSPLGEFLLGSKICCVPC